MPLVGLWFGGAGAFRSAPSDLWPWTQGEAQPLKWEPRGKCLVRIYVAFDNHETIPQVLFLWMLSHGN